MEIRKESKAGTGGKPDQGQLEAINALAKAELKAEEVYVFPLRLCDDQVDRDHEKFDSQALGELAKLFVGKSGIVDHQWSAKEQVARIFQTQVAEEDGIRFVKAWAYIRRGGKGEEWIADIEAGIKKEVSVGCAMGRKICSICGSAYGSCGHQKGSVYDGQMCVAILQEPVDAYEFSFVAVPAQAQAGVMKGKNPGRAVLKDLADRYGAQEEYQVMHSLAQLGKEYQEQLRQEVVRLCLALEVGVEKKTLDSAAGKLGHEELTALKKALEALMGKKYPLERQLGTGKMETWDPGFQI